MIKGMSDDLIGKTMEVDAPHAGHRVTVERVDEIEKHNAYWVKCSCGKRTTISKDELPHMARTGLISNWLLR